MACIEIAAYILSACICAFSIYSACRDRNLKIGFKIFILCFQSLVFIIAIAAAIVTLSELL